MPKGKRAMSSPTTITSYSRPVRVNSGDARRAAESTFQAVAYVLRQYGMRRLDDPWLTARLGEFSDAQIVELIAALGRMQQRYPALTNALIAQITTLRGDL
jgi:hypothetical protein